jgi:hypothetical protein
LISVCSRWGDGSQLFFQRLPLLLEGVEAFLELAGRRLARPCLRWAERPDVGDQIVSLLLADPAAERKKETPADLFF